MKYPLWALEEMQHARTRGLETLHLCLIRGIRHYPFTTAAQVSSPFCLTPPITPTNYLPSTNPPQNTILKSLISQTTPSSDTPPSFKYVVNSTIIQHHASPTESTTAGRRGMHSAQGAYWNSEKDGMWSYKWDAAEKKGLDVVIMVVWIGL